jgi:T5SS/PEP-CTERM-associated repeat protein
MLFIGLSGGGGGSATPSGAGNNAVAISGTIGGVLNGTGARDTLVLGGAGGGAGAGTAGYRGGNGAAGSNGFLTFQNGINSLTVNNLFIGGDGGSAASYLSGKAGNGGTGNLYLSGKTVDAGTITVGGTAGLGDSSQAGAGGNGSLNIDGASSVTTTGGILVRDTGSINISHSVGMVLLDTDISGAGTYSQTGGGTTILTGADSRTGSTTVTSGVLQIGNGGTTGAITGNVSIASGATLAFNRSNALTYGGVISGNGKLTNLGEGTLTFNGATPSTMSELRVSNGTVNVMTKIQSANGYVDYNGGDSTKTAVVNVSGANSIWENSDSFYVATSGTGTLSINDGGTVSAKSVVLGEYASGSSTLNLNNTGSARGVLSTVSVSKGPGTAVFNWNGGIL